MPPLCTLFYAADEKTEQMTDEYDKTIVEIATQKKDDFFTCLAELSSRRLLVTTGHVINSLYLFYFSSHNFL